ncbi:uncharacterized protein BJ171DRAFT_639913 [Polychytrium aggregatum]|uniref:uncharacterized protein n=1 Tax=Polychytrium aggregatum TaxID=110093 RepID=UPI0022FDF0B0|nr:uncharacterized protein BJ171DRAFT_639913 [Polychytrium aggregatum]KAI9207170.1 hypothetical protein BJ171DRAFT_639913 [Polychytrium aggregatum]
MEVGASPMYHPCTNCLQNIPQIKFSSHLRMCKGPSKPSVGASQEIHPNGGPSSRQLLFSPNTSPKPIPPNSKTASSNDIRASPHPPRPVKIGSLSMMPRLENSGKQRPSSRPPSSKGPMPSSLAKDIKASQGADAGRSDDAPLPVGQYTIVESEIAQAEQDAHPRIPCEYCGRKFHEDRLLAHIKACQSAKGASRRVFDSKKARSKGTENEKYTLESLGKGSSKLGLSDRTNRSIGGDGLSTTAKQAKSNWKIKHENFIRMVRAARSPAGSVGAVFVPSEPDPDYIQCSKCERRFNEEAAKRHIPICKGQNSISRTKPSNSGSAVTSRSSSQVLSPQKGRSMASLGSSVSDAISSQSQSPSSSVATSKEDLLKKRMGFRPPALKRPQQQLARSR